MNEGELLPKTIQGVEKKDIVKTSGGISIGKEIWLTPSTALSYFEKLIHEIGHTLGRELSFREGEVLSPDEVRHTNLQSTLPIGILKTNRIFDKLRDTTTLLDQPDKELNEVIFKLVEVFTKGKFDPKKLIIHTGVSEEEIKRKIKRTGGSATSLIAESGEEIQTNTRQGRNIELSAIATQIACREILLNTFRGEGITFIWKYEFDRNEDPSHHRATRIVERAYKGKSWNLPSMKDLTK